MTSVSAAEVAVEVDRLVIAVHRTVMARHRSRIGPLIEKVGVGSPGHFYDLAEFLAAGACDFDVARRRFRYDGNDTATTMLEQLRDSHLINAQHRPSIVLLEVANAILDTRAHAASELWDRDLSVILRGAAEALSSASGLLTDSFRSLPEPVEPAHCLHHRLTGLRYARLDAHIGAWEEVGLEAVEMVALSPATTEPVSSPPDGLVSRGWLMPNGAITADGRAARSMIEATTNERGQALLATVSELDRWYKALCSLPSSD